MAQETDWDLIQACRKGDAKAWEHLLEKYERLVYSIPLNYGLTVEDAADITQITFIILMQSLYSLHDDTRLAHWLTTVTRRHTWRWMERKRRENINPDRDITEDELLGGRNNSLEQWDRFEWLNYGLNMLDKRCRELLLALYFDPNAPSYGEIAERLRMPVGSIGPTRARCLKHLKQWLTKVVKSTG